MSEFEIVRIRDPRHLQVGDCMIGLAPGVPRKLGILTITSFNADSGDCDLVPQDGGRTMTFPLSKFIAYRAPLNIVYFFRVVDAAAHVAGLEEV